MTAPEPFTPADADLRDFDKLMLNVDRLMGSELWAISTGDEFKAAVGLWCRAWKQVPAGSLPNDERVLAAFSGAGSKWKKVRDVALRGFVLCSDGRLYHKVLCEDALRAIDLREGRRGRTAAATEARRRQREVERDDQRNVERDDDQEGNVTRRQRRDVDVTEERLEIKPESGQLPRARARGSNRSPEWIKSRWEQKVMTEITQQMPPPEAIAAIESYQRGEPEGIRLFNDIDRAMKAGKP